MHFTHRTDATRTAQLSELDGAPAVAELRWSDAAGKARKKRFTHALARNARDKALSLLFTEGFVLCAPQPGTLQWLTITREPYPAGYRVAVDRTTKSVWVGETGALRRIAWGDCAQTDVALGEGVTPRAVGCSRAGHVFAVLELQSGAVQGTPPWRAPARGAAALGLATLDGELRPKVLFELPFDIRAAVTDSLSVADDGRLLAPHRDGAGLYEADGTLVRTFAVARTQHTSPRVALSPDGRWAAFTADEGAIRIVDVASGAEHVVLAGFSQVHDLSVGNSGNAWVGGFLERWGLHRVTPGEAPLLTTDRPTAMPTPDETAVLEVDVDRVHLRAVDRAANVRFGARLGSSEVLALGLRKNGGPLFVSDTEAIVRGDTQTVAGLDLTRLGPPQPDPS